jgi:uncharacterized protein (TIGR02001 family)
MRFQSVFRIALIAAAVTPGAALAQVMTPVGVLIPEVSVLSDYRFDGMSSSDRQPTVQGLLHLWRPDGWYAGGLVSHVRHNDGRHTDIEVVLYGGKNLELEKTRLTAEVMAITFPDQRGDAPTYDYVQVTGKARRSLGPVAVTGIVTYTPEASFNGGPAWKLASELEWPASRRVAFSGRFGVYESKERQDRTYWNAGMTLKHEGITLDLRYHGTNLKRAQCFYTDWCEDGIAAKLSFLLPNPRRGLPAAP